MPSYPPQGNPGSMLDTTPNDGLLVGNLKPSAKKGKGGPPVPLEQKLSKLKGFKKKRKALKKKALKKLKGMRR